MKKTLFSMFVALAVLTACEQSQEDNRPAVSFETAIPIMANEVATFSIVVNGYEGMDPVTIPVTFEGTAEKDVDYVVSAEEFVWGGDNVVTSITVTPLILGTEKTIRLTLQIPDGFKAGNFASSEFTVPGKLANISFESDTFKSAADKMQVKVTATDMNGSYILENGGQVKVTVNTEKSTAIEGTHFNFTDEVKAAVFEAGESSGFVGITRVGDVVDGKNTVVLDIEATDKFGIGSNSQVTVTFISYWEGIDGKWVVNEFITNKAYIMEGMWATEDQMVGFPDINKDDVITFDVKNKKLIPGFVSDFKNFFIGESGMTNEGGYTLTAGMGDKRSLQYIKLDNTNRDFSAKTQSADKESYIAARIIMDEETEEELLDLYLIDYYPTDFLQFYYEWFMFDTNKPCATMTYVFLNLTFKRAAN